MSIATDERDATAADLLELFDNRHGHMRTRGCTFLVRFKANTNLQSVYERGERLGVRWLADPDALLAPFHCARTIPDLSRKKAADAYEFIRDWKEVDIVELDGVGSWQSHVHIEHLIQSPPDQWNLRQVHSHEGMVLPSGARQVVIAILDSGFDLDHPSLNYVDRRLHFNAGQYFARRQMRNRLVRGLYDAGPSTAPHGTAVAGIAAAKPTRVPEGAIHFQGIAPGFPVLPIRLGLEPTAVQTAAGISWARKRGAAVINMSFNVPRREVVKSAVRKAWKAGIILCAASGNYTLRSPNRSVDFPASVDEILAVGATDASDRRKEITTLDRWDWGSQYGNGLDLVAPGVGVPTLDERDERGYVPGDYSTNNIGTSVAAPHVAGLAAFLRAANPSLSNREICDVIVRTCERSPEYEFERTRGRRWPWNREVGHGRIECLRAFEAVDS